MGPHPIEQVDVDGGGLWLKERVYWPTDIATLGRAEDNDVVVKGNLISRVHARIESSRDKFTLIDESTNGTFVQTSSGEEIFVRRDRAPLTGEGVIGLGRVAQPGTALAVHYVIEE